MLFSMEGFPLKQAKNKKADTVENGTRLILFVFRLIKFENHTILCYVFLECLPYFAHRSNPPVIRICIRRCNIWFSLTFFGFIHLLPCKHPVCEMITMPLHFR